MKFYSEVLKKYYDSDKECLAAEKEYEDRKAKEDAEKKKITEQRKARAKEVEEAYTACVEANKKFIKLRDAFTHDFGSFHMTFSSKDDFDTLFDNLFRIF